MASRRLAPASVREALLGIPSDIASLERNYLLADEDLELIGTRRRAENRLGLALHIALLRHPGQGWLDDTEPPAPLVAWLAEQIDVPFPALARYGTREATRSSHRRLAAMRANLSAADALDSTIERHGADGVQLFEHAAPVGEAPKETPPATAFGRVVRAQEHGAT